MLDVPWGTVVSHWDKHRDDGDTHLQNKKDDSDIEPKASARFLFCEQIGAQDWPSEIDCGDRHSERNNKYRQSGERLPWKNIGKDLLKFRDDSQHKKEAPRAEKKDNKEAEFEPRTALFVGGQSFAS
jgi:hypothetical protein